MYYCMEEKESISKTFSFRMWKLFIVEDKTIDSLKFFIDALKIGFVALTVDAFDQN